MYRSLFAQRLEGDNGADSSDFHVAASRFRLRMSPGPKSFCSLRAQARVNKHPQLRV